jgi:protein O-mannosyl-transferase
VTKDNKYACLIIILLIIASCIAFGRIVGNGFINFDDNIYITGNNHIKSGINLENIKWALTAVVLSNWHPITLLSHMLDWSLFGANPAGHHLVSLLFHIGAVILLFLFLNKTTNNLWPSAFAAALFALHPLRVESVAWASERKDVLSVFFGMACIYVYAFYAESPKLSKYLLCLTLFVLSLMSKPMLVTLPFILMLLDYWPLGRWQRGTDDSGNRFNSTCRLIREKVPFILLTVVVSFLTFWSQNKSFSVAYEDILPFSTRFANATVSYVVYLVKIFWPVNLAIYYPYNFSLPLWKVLFSGMIITGITITVLYYIRKLPFLFVGWFWYAGTLTPVIGFIQVGLQSMADRYTYLPSIGVAIMIAWGISYLFPSVARRKRILFFLLIIVFIVLTLLTWRQCGYWKNSIKLFNHTLNVTKDNSMIHLNLGLVLFDEGRIKEAVDHYNEAIHINPDDVDAYFNRGNAYAGLRQYQLAIDNYKEVIRLMPSHAAAYNNSGNIYAGIGQYGLAIENYSEAIRLESNYIGAYYNRGAAYYNLGQYQRAIENYEKVISLQQDHVEAYNNMGSAYLMQGNKERGCYYVQKACELGNCTTFNILENRGYCR